MLCFLLVFVSGFNVAPRTVFAATLAKAKVSADERACKTTTPSSVDVALLQLSVSNDKDVNIASAKENISSAAMLGAQLIVLPEVWNSPYATAAFPEYAETIPGGPSSAMLVAAAQEHGVWIVGGSIPEVDEAGRVYNSCPIINPDGQIVAVHRKGTMCLLAYFPHFF